MEKVPTEVWLHSEIHCLGILLWQGVQPWHRKEGQLCANSSLVE